MIDWFFLKKKLAVPFLVFGAGLGQAAFTVPDILFLVWQVLRMYLQAGAVADYCGLEDQTYEAISQVCTRERGG